MSKAIETLLKEYKDTMQSCAPTLQRLSTGLPNVDWMLGGGLPKGRITQVVGASSTGKTLFALHCIKHAQSLGLSCALIDMEKTVESSRLSSVGIDQTSGNFIYSAPPTGNEALLHVEKFSEAGVDLIILDSVAACFPKEEVLSDAGDFADKVSIGAQARLFRNWLPRLVNQLSRNNTTLVCLNQERTKIQTFGFGNPVTYPGGQAMVFYSSIMMKINRIGDDKKEKGRVHVKYKTIKNKTAVNSREADIDLMAEGIDIELAEQQILINLDFELFTIKGTANYHFHPDVIASGVLDPFGFDYSNKFCYGKEATINMINSNYDLKSALLNYVSNNKLNNYIPSMTLENDDEAIQLEEV